MIKIIGISANMGAGKTTLTNALAETLNATRLHWDDFDEISTHPIDYVAWYHRGQDYSEWNYEALADTLRSLKNNQIVPHPVLKNLLHPTELIVFDAPLGRLHNQTGQYIDFCIHITLPLDVSLCRWVLRNFKSNQKTKTELLEELEYYLSHSRPLFFDDDLKSSADFVVDGMLTTEEQIIKISEFLTGSGLTY
jgi:uridine kinase